MYQLRCELILTPKPQLLLCQWKNSCQPRFAILIFDAFVGVHPRLDRNIKGGDVRTHSSFGLFTKDCEIIHQLIGSRLEATFVRLSYLSGLKHAVVGFHL